MIMIIIIIIHTNQMKFCPHVSTERICGRRSKVGCSKRRDFRRVARSTADHSM